MLYCWCNYSQFSSKMWTYCPHIIMFDLCLVCSNGSNLWTTLKWQRTTVDRSHIADINIVMVYLEPDWNCHDNWEVYINYWSSQAAPNVRNHCMDKDSLSWVSPPHFGASGKIDTTIWWIWFITEEKQRQAAGGGARLVNRWGKEKEQQKKTPQNDDGIIQISCFLAGWACRYNIQSDAKKKMGNILYGQKNYQLVWPRLLSSIKQWAFFYGQGYWQVP